MSEDTLLATYEVWRAGPQRHDVRLYFGLTEEQARRELRLCEKDKAEAYPDAPIEFFLVRATRERIA